LIKLGPKEVGKKLATNDEQLTDYFAKDLEARLGILTNGVQLRFFTVVVNSNMSEDGGLDLIEESFLAAASCSWRRATVASSAFNRASWASNFACKRRQFGQDFRALGLMASYASHMVGNTQHR